MTATPKHTPTLREFEPRSPRRIGARLIVWAAVWTLLRLPVAVPDFHEVAHHHFEGVNCLYHEHLNRWHGTGEPDDSGAPHQHDPATLHWHWVIPGSTLPESEGGEADPFDNGAKGPAITRVSGPDFLNDVLEAARHCSATIDQVRLERSEAGPDLDTLPDHAWIVPSFFEFRRSRDGHFLEFARHRLSTETNRPLRC